MSFMVLQSDICDRIKHVYKFNTQNYVTNAECTEMYNK